MRGDLLEVSMASGSSTGTGVPGCSSSWGSSVVAVDAGASGDDGLACVLLGFESNGDG